MPSYFHVNFLNNTCNLGQYTPINVKFSTSRGRLEVITKKEEKQIKFKYENIRKTIYTDGLNAISDTLLAFTN